MKIENLRDQFIAIVSNYHIQLFDIEYSKNDLKLILQETIPFSTIFYDSIITKLDFCQETNRLFIYDSSKNTQVFEFYLRKTNFLIFHFLNIHFIFK